TPTAGMLNPYTYATGDPINHTDPTGQSPANAFDWGQFGLDAAFLTLNVAALALTPSPYGLIAKLGLTAGVMATGLDTATIVDKYKQFIPDEWKDTLQKVGYALTAVDVVGGVYGGAVLGAKAAGKFRMPNMVEGAAEGFSGDLNSLARNLKTNVGNKSTVCFAPAIEAANVLSGSKMHVDWSSVGGQFATRSVFEKAVGKKFAGPFTKAEMLEHVAKQPSGSHGVAIGANLNRKNPVMNGVMRFRHAFDTTGQVGHYFNVVNFQGSSAAVDGYVGTVKDIVSKVDSPNYIDRFYYMDMGSVVPNVKRA
ncbi:hypothetical protein ACFZAV_40755, partial [Streptomyces sp. NPDC008343]|uniref:hypothetical protein n=1 Tax=Streptomyces sp. NPDC008343 TaxID=3364828 RepID=UPI0036F0BAD3